MLDHAASERAINGVINSAGELFNHKIPTAGISGSWMYSIISVPNTSHELYPVSRLSQLHWPIVCRHAYESC